MSQTITEQLNTLAGMSPNDAAYASTKKAIAQAIKTDSSYALGDFFECLINTTDLKRVKLYSSFLDLYIKRSLKKPPQRFDSRYVFVNNLNADDKALVHKKLLSLLKKSLKETKSPAHFACEVVFLSMLKFSGLYDMKSVLEQLLKFEGSYGQIPLQTISIYQDDDSDTYPIEFVLRLIQLMLVFFPESSLNSFLRQECHRTGEDYFEVEVFWLENYEFLRMFAPASIGKSLGMLVKQFQKLHPTLSFKQLGYNQFQRPVTPEDFEEFELDEGDDDEDFELFGDSTNSPA